MNRKEDEEEEEWIEKNEETKNGALQKLSWMLSICWFEPRPLSLSVDPHAKVEQHLQHACTEKLKEKKKNIMSSEKKKKSKK